MAPERLVLATPLLGDLLDLVLGVLGWEAAGVIARVERSNVGILGTRAAFLSHTGRYTPRGRSASSMPDGGPPSPRSNAHGSRSSTPTGRDGPRWASVGSIALPRGDTRTGPPQSPVRALTHLDDPARGPDPATSRRPTASTTAPSHRAGSVADHLRRHLIARVDLRPLSLGLAIGATLAMRIQKRMEPPAKLPVRSGRSVTAVTAPHPRPGVATSD